MSNFLVTLATETVASSSAALLAAALSSEPVKTGLTVLLTAALSALTRFFVTVHLTKARRRRTIRRLKKDVPS